MQDHGGNRREALAAFGLRQVLDFSASINPLGHPEGLREHLCRRWEEVLHYPERGAPALTDALSSRHGISRDRILVGNGSAELIDLALRALVPRRLVLCPPDFSLYEELSRADTPCLRIPRVESRGFAPDMGAVRAAVGVGDLVLLSNPGNPSGAGVPRGEMLELWQRCQAVGATLVVDEAFGDFCPGRSVLDEAGRADGLLVLRSMTKFYGIPGLRLGYAVGSGEAVAALARLQVAWSVNALAQEAGLHCVAPADWGDRTLACVERARGLLSEGLAALPGFRPLPSEANYLLVELRPPAPSASSLYDALARRGILIRHCGSFGLGERYVRVAVRTLEENAVLLEALAKLAAEGDWPNCH